MDEMKILLDSANGMDVFGLCETFLTETTENDALSISGYNIERKDRCETNSTTDCQKWCATRLSSWSCSVLTIYE